MLLLKSISLKKLILASVFPTLFFINGCATTSSVKDPGNIEDTYQANICGELNYKGHNKTYLPRSIKNTPAKTNHKISYEYQVKYGLEEDTLVDLFNPLTLIGVPKSKDAITVLGLLTFDGPGDFEKEFKFAILMEKYRNIFSEGATLSEIRKNGLISLRNKIDQMVVEEMDLLQQNGFNCH